MAIADAVYKKTHQGKIRWVGSRVVDKEQGYLDEAFTATDGAIAYEFRYTRPLPLSLSAITKRSRSTLIVRDSVSGDSVEIADDTPHLVTVLGSLWVEARQTSQSAEQETLHRILNKVQAGQ